MTRTLLSARRPAFLALLAALAIALAIAVAVDAEPSSSATNDQAAHTHGHAATAAEAKALTGAQAAFQDDMRRLWEDHVTWTRLAIVTFADGSASFDATAARLLKNQDDIGDAIKPFYGDAAGEQLTALLKDHIGVAVQLLQAAKAGDDEAFGQANAAWYRNSDDIADFLAGADPKNWPQATMRAAMKGHLDQTLAEASHELTGKYAESVADYDEIHHHILQMADVLSTGIMRSFPEKFH